MNVRQVGGVTSWHSEILDLIGVLRILWKVSLTLHLLLLFNSSESANLVQADIWIKWHVWLFFIKTERPKGEEEEKTEGVLHRKHEWESTTKKATSRFTEAFILSASNTPCIFIFITFPSFLFPFLLDHGTRCMWSCMVQASSFTRTTSLDQLPLMFIIMEKLHWTWLADLWRLHLTIPRKNTFSESSACIAIVLLSTLCNHTEREHLSFIF